MYMAAVEGAETLVGADVGCGLLPPDVLLAGCQGQDKAPVSLHVDPLPDQPAWNAAHVGPPGCEHAESRPAEGSGEAQTLPLSADNVGTLLPRGPEKTVGKSLRKGGHEEGLLLVCRLPDGLQVLDTSEEIRRLHGHGRQVLDPIEHRKVGPSVLQVGKLDKFEAGGLR